MSPAVVFKSGGADRKSEAELQFNMMSQRRMSWRLAAETEASSAGGGGSGGGDDDDGE